MYNKIFLRNLIQVPSNLQFKENILENDEWNYSEKVIFFSTKDFYTFPLSMISVRRASRRLRLTFFRNFHRFLAVLAVRSSPTPLACRANRIHRGEAKRKKKGEHDRVSSVILKRTKNQILPSNVMKIITIPNKGGEELRD